VDLRTGERSLPWGGTSENTEAIWRRAALAIDSTNSRALVVQSRINTLSAVDLDTGDTEVIMDGLYGMDTYFSFSAASVMAAPSGERALLIDDDSYRVVGVDLENGRNWVLSDYRDYDWPRGH